MQNHPNLVLVLQLPPCPLALANGHAVDIGFRVPGKIHCVPASLKGLYVIRFTVTSTNTTSSDIIDDWLVIQNMASEILASVKDESHPARISLREVKKRSPTFGTSLLLSNSPMTPKVIDGSFVALFENPEVIHDFVKQFGNFNITVQPSPARRRRIKGLMVSDKQYSLDSRMDIVNTIVATMGDPKCDRRNSLHGRKPTSSDGEY